MGQPGTGASAPLYPAIADPDASPAQGDHCVMSLVAETISTFQVHAELLQMNGISSFSSVLKESSQHPHL